LPIVCNCDSHILWLVVPPTIYHVTPIELDSSFAPTPKSSHLDPNPSNLPWTYLHFARSFRDHRLFHYWIHSFHNECIDHHMDHEVLHPPNALAQ
jgi:hypothetical protein